MCDGVLRYDFQEGMVKSVLQDESTYGDFQLVIVTSVTTFPTTYTLSNEMDLHQH